uniref:Transmembrane protein 205 n=1 Tax=Callorhinchus milii TaxID=7868 RepID=A0A4W3GWZ7_CALMI|eukprot:gi/632989668/ref/XP_007883772.1/ PREDICTED: transmembrane protein 205 [Callorhinchus milii]
MPTEGEPTQLVKLTHLTFLSTMWGAQIWMTFVAGTVLRRNVPRHTFGLVQSKLFPYYLFGVLGGSFLSLALYAVYHPREMLSPAESLQVASLFVCVLCAGLNAQWFGQSTSSLMFKMYKIEKEHGLGEEVGVSRGNPEYQRLRDTNPNYQDLSHRFVNYHIASVLCNLVCLVCTGINLVCTATNLQTF